MRRRRICRSISGIFPVWVDAPGRRGRGGGYRYTELPVTAGKIFCDRDREARIRPYQGFAASTTAGKIFCDRDREGGTSSPSPSAPPPMAISTQSDEWRDPGEDRALPRSLGCEVMRVLTGLPSLPGRAVPESLRILVQEAIARYNIAAASFPTTNVTQCYSNPGKCNRTVTPAGHP